MFFRCTNSVNIVWKWSLRWRPGSRRRIQYCYIWIISILNVVFFQNQRLDFSSYMKHCIQGSNARTLSSCWLLFSLVINFFPDNGFLVVGECGSTVINFELISTIQLMFLHNHWPDFLFHFLNLKLSCLVWVIDSKLADFDPSDRILVIEGEKNYVRTDKLIYWKSSSSIMQA